ncbi:MAG: 5-amino-6-(D-ribitylamino)uracil--L-tyrosine 4-hydroxyphenyl transferase CofH [Alphaproteobacteria bacterium]|nr:5-amino-6-(D-ribitylamino)uracil--L-tyrosine 4-hydroxyphenyl transferase CofH [Alphaproteobacteria bacterium]
MDIDPELGRASVEVARILERPFHGKEVAPADAVRLFAAQGADRNALFRAADALCRQSHGDRASFVVCRNINFTNICYMGCQFCGFAKRRDQEGAEVLELNEIVRRAREARDRGATEICIQGGLNPHLDWRRYQRMVEAIKAELPDLHIHAFSPFEIWYGAKQAKMAYRDYILDLKAAGLGSMPGTAAEILDVTIRKQLTRDKLSTDDWVTIVKAAHAVGVPSTATIMYGHIDGPEHWAAHLDLLRKIQKETGGFTELVPLGFVHQDSPLYHRRDDVRAGPSEDESLKMHAVARVMLHGHIDNIQVSWVKLGHAMAVKMLQSGANDLGGTLMNESISRAAGATYGQEMTPSEMVALARAAGRVPFQRSTLYETLDVFDDHDPAPIDPLVARDGIAPLDFLST